MKYFEMPPLFNYLDPHPVIYAYDANRGIVMEAVLLQWAMGKYTHAKSDKLKLS
jgi:hypothetical protein